MIKNIKVGDMVESLSPSCIPLFWPTHRGEVTRIKNYKIEILGFKFFKLIKPLYQIDNCFWTTECKKIIRCYAEMSND